MNSNNISVYPTKFEGYDPETGYKLFVVENFDECTVTVKIDQVFNVSGWENAAKEISNCIAQMVNSNGID